MIIGFKCWYADGTKVVVGVHGRPQHDVQASVDALPSSGVQVVMVYFDDHSTMNCPQGHNTPFKQTVAHAHGRACPICHTSIAEQATRYRRVVQGNDHYFVVYDTMPAPPFQDWLIGQTDKASDLDRYAALPGVKFLEGRFLNDTAYKAIVDEAMHDHDVSQFGVTPERGTIDR